MPSTFTPRTQEDEEDDEDAYEDEEHYECEDSRCSDEIRHDMCMSLAACDDPENAHEYLFCRGGNVSDHLHETTPRRDRRGERDRKQTLTMSGSSAPAELPSVAVGTEETSTGAASSSTSQQTGPATPTPTNLTTPPVITFKDIFNIAQQLTSSCIRGSDGNLMRVSDEKLVHDEFLTDVVRAIEGVYVSHAS